MYIIDVNGLVLPTSVTENQHCGQAYSTLAMTSTEFPQHRGEPHHSRLVFIPQEATFTPFFPPRWKSSAILSPPTVLCFLEWVMREKERKRENLSQNMCLIE